MLSSLADSSRRAWDRSGSRTAKARKTFWRRSMSNFYASRNFANILRTWKIMEIRFVLRISWLGGVSWVTWNASTREQDERRDEQPNKHCCKIAPRVCSLAWVVPRNFRKLQNVHLGFPWMDLSLLDELCLFVHSKLWNLPSANCGPLVWEKTKQLNKIFTAHAKFSIFESLPTSIYFLNIRENLKAKENWKYEKIEISESLQCAHRHDSRTWPETHTAVWPCLSVSSLPQVPDCNLSSSCTAQNNHFRVRETAMNHHRVPIYARKLHMHASLTHCSDMKYIY